MLPDYQTNYIAMVIKMVQLWWIDAPTDKGTKQAILGLTATSSNGLWQCDKEIQYGKNIPSTNGAENTEYPFERKKESALVLPLTMYFKKISSIWVIDLNIKAKVIKLLEK